jgi:hypothetical protein
MVLTRRQTRELLEQGTKESSGDDCPVGSDSLPSTSKTPEHRLYDSKSERGSGARLHSPEGALTPAGQAREPGIAGTAMHSSARKGVSSHPLKLETGVPDVDRTRQKMDPSPLRRPLEQFTPVDLEPPPIVLPSGPEPQQNMETCDMYPVLESFVPLEDANQLASFKAHVLSGMGSTEWVDNVRAMNGLRRVAYCYADEVDSLLDNVAVMSTLIKSIKSPRSNVSKSAIITTRDLFCLRPDRMGAFIAEDPQLKNTNSLLSVLLTKASSNEKKFVVDEAVASLDRMSRRVDRGLVLAPVLAGCTEHKNPKVRGRSFMLLSRLLSREGEQVRGESEAGFLLTGGVLESIVVACHKGSTDNTPEARESSRGVLSAVLFGGLRGGHDDGGGDAGFEDAVREYMEEFLRRLARDGSDRHQGQEDASNNTLQGTETGDDGDSLVLRYVSAVLGNRGKAVLLLQTLWKL